MAKYTTLVKSVCEQASGISTQGLSNINNILDKSWNKIFTSNWEIFDESYREVLCKKILRKYYTREIGAETVELWELWLDATMCEIMPKYNKLYESETFKYNPLYNVDMTTEFTKNVKGTNSSDTTSNSETENNVNNTDNINTTKVADNGKVEQLNEVNKFNDTPQGGLTDIESNNYLTDVRMISHDNTVSDSINESTDVNGVNTSAGTSIGKDTTKQSGKNETTETWTEKVMGKNSGENYSRLIQEFRDSIINVDKMIIDELGVLFCTLW